MPNPQAAPLPTSAEAAAAMLPAARIAAREKFGRVRMVFLAPILTVLLTMMGEFLVKWIASWLAKREPSPALLALAAKWDAEAMPEVKVGLRRAAAGETGL